MCNFALIGMTRGDALLTNGTVIADLSKSLAKYCPNAFVCIISDPVKVFYDDLYFKSLGN